MSMSVNSFSSMSTRKGIGGLASGLDTDTLIEQMTAGTRSKITSQLQQRELAIWKRDAYREISSKMRAFSDNYFSYTKSSSNILSSGFFNVAKAVSSNPSAVKVTGNAQSAKNVVINEIKQLASKATFTSDHKVSNQTMSTGKLYENWDDNTLAGKSMKINYNNKEYIIAMNSNFFLDSHDVANKGDWATAVKDELNKQINSLTDLKGKVQVAISGDKFVLEKVGGANGAPAEANLSLVSGNVDLLSALGMYAGEAENGKITAKDSIRPEAFFEHNNLAGATILFNIDGTSTPVKIDPNFRFQSDSGKTKTEQVQDALNKAIKDAKIDDKLSATVTETAGKFSLSFKATGADSKLKILGGTSLESLGLKATEDTDTVGDTITGTDVALIKANEKNLKDVLSGTTLTFNYNGISKTITFKAEDSEDFKDPTKLQTYVQKALDKSIGQDRVKVTLGSDGKMNFQTWNSETNAVDGNSVLTLQAANKSGILGEGGALRILSGESNRVEYTKTLGQLKDEMNLAPDADGKYKMTINDVDFEFTEDTLLGDVISKINAHPDAGVRISYSSVTDVFNVTAKESGKQGKIDIKDSVGNLSAALFGKNKDDPSFDPGVDHGYKVIAGQDAKINVSFDNGNTFVDIERSENTFTVDDVGFELLKKTTAGDQITFTVESNSDELFDKIKGFITAYNEIADLITAKTTEKKKGQEDGNYNGQTSYPPLTDEQKKEMSDDEIKTWTENAKKGILRNDQTLYNVELSMRRAMSDALSNTNEALYQIGIATKAYSYDANGHMEIDEAALKAAILEDPEKVTRIFTAQDTGVAYRLKTALDDAVGLSGDQGVLLQMAGRDDGLSVDQSTMTKRIQGMSDQLKVLRDRLQTEEDRYWKQFSQLETYISQMNAQSSWLTQQTGG